jgi:hypothetical protein
MSGIAAKWDVANTVRIVVSALAATGAETIAAAKVVYESALQRNSEARHLREGLQQSATAMRARTEATATLPALLIQTAAEWRAEEARELSRLEEHRRGLAEANSIAVHAIQSLDARTKRASESVRSIQELTEAAATLEESVDRRLAECRDMLDEAGALQLQLEEVLREVTR